MMVFAVGIELASVVAVQCLHDTDPRQHRRPVLRLRDQDQGLNGRLPFLDLLFGLRQLLDISGGILESDKLATAGQRDWILEFALPTPARY
jgi:hypothetical protein